MAVEKEGDLGIPWKEIGEREVDCEL